MMHLHLRSFMVLCPAVCAPIPSQLPSAFWNWPIRCFLIAILVIGGIVP